MIRQRALKVVLIVVGLAFTAMIYPVTTILLHRDKSGYTDAMMGSIYITLGVLLLIAVRNPSAHRSLIAFAAWSSLAHAFVMTIMVLRDPSARELLAGIAIFVAAGIPLLVLAPPRQSAEQTSTAHA
jgi:tryptophan-rich sensory protein